MVEELTAGEAHEIVAANAMRKAESVAARVGGGPLVIAGDTGVELDDEVLGQPGDAKEARSHLERLSGRDHRVLGALALLGPDDAEPRSGVEATKVGFRELEAPLIDAYLASGEWRGRAGSYAIQGLGSALVESVQGDVSNVIGLPVGLLAGLAPELFQSP